MCVTGIDFCLFFSSRFRLDFGSVHVLTILFVIIIFNCTYISMTINTIVVITTDNNFNKKSNIQNIFIINITIKYHKNIFTHCNK